MASPVGLIWMPGQGPHPPAIDRLRAHGPRPSEPIGEPWFMGPTRAMHDELLRQPGGRADARVLASALWDIASGTTSFGHRREWDSWFDHLLPDLVVRAGEHKLLECTMTSFFALYWDGIPERYREFRRDVLDTLGLSLMSQAPFGRSFLEEPRLDAWFEVPGELSASLCFCLKYLDQDELPGWIDSLLAIDRPGFRASLLVWMLGARDLLRDPAFGTLRLSRTRPPIAWENAYLLENAASGPEHDQYARPFLPAASCSRFLARVLGHLDEHYIDWLEAIWQDAVLEQQLCHLPEQFFDEFLASRAR